MYCLTYLKRLFSRWTSPLYPGYTNDSDPPSLPLYVRNSCAKGNAV